MSNAQEATEMDEAELFDDNPQESAADVNKMVEDGPLDDIAFGEANL